MGAKLALGWAVGEEDGEGARTSRWPQRHCQRVIEPEVHEIDSLRKPCYDVNATHSVCDWIDSKVRDGTYAAPIADATSDYPDIRRILT